MSGKQAIDYAALLLRLTLGILLLLHAGLKVFVFTLPGTVQFFQSLGLPGPFAYVVILWEVIAGVALVLGVWTRLAALIVIPDLLGAMVLVHFPAGFFFTNTGGGWEYLALWIVALVVQALIGDGGYALRRSQAGRDNGLTCRWRSGVEPAVAVRLQCFKTVLKHCMLNLPISCVLRRA